jgi:hypothetical protein
MFLPLVNQSKLTQDITLVLQAFSSFIVCVGLFCGFAYNIDQRLQQKQNGKTLQTIEEDDQEFQAVDGNTVNVEKITIQKMKKDDDVFVCQQDSEEQIVIGQTTVVKRTGMYQESDSDSSSSDLEDEEEDNKYIQ